MTFFSKAGEQRATRSHALDLGHCVFCVNSFLVHVFCVVEFAFWDAGNYGSIFGSWHIRNSSDDSIALFKFLVFASGLLQPLHLHIIKVDSSTMAAICESRVILKPLDRLDFTCMSLALLISRACKRVKIVDIGLCVDTHRKKLSTIAKSDFFAILKSQTMLLSN